MLAALFDHLAWADTRTRDALLEMTPGTPEHARAVAIYAHLASAEHTWLARLEQRASAHPVWPALDVGAATALAAESAAGLRAFVAALGPDEQDREIAYRNSAGQELRSRVSDVLVHVALHGSHHRGQLALLARAAGNAPALTDYIVFVRGVPVPPAPTPAGAPPG